MSFSSSSIHLKVGVYFEAMEIKPMQSMESRKQVSLPNVDDYFEMS